MPKIRHLAFRCKDPRKIGEFLNEAFGLEILYVNEPTGTCVVSDGETNITLNTEKFEFDWHFGLEMPIEEVAGRRSLLEKMGQPTSAVTDGRPVEEYSTTPEGHRIDMGPFWPTLPGQHRRNREAAPLDDETAERLKNLPKIRHIAFCCKDTHSTADFLAEAFDLDVLYHTGPSVVVMSDGNINITILPESFTEHDPVLWHFGIEMPVEQIEELKPKLEEMGVEMKHGVADGRPVEEFIHTPEGHRIDLAAYWPTKHGQPRRIA